MSGQSKEVNRETKTSRNKLVLTVIFIIFQVIWISVIYSEIIAYSTWITFIVNLLSLVIVIYLAGKNENSTYKIGWIIFIMMFPVAATPMYLMFGNKRQSRRLRKKLELEYDDLRPFVEQNKEVLDELKSIDPRVCGLSKYLFDISDNPIYKNTDVKYYPLGEDMFLDMLEDMKNAKKFIFLEYFIIEQGYMWDKMLEILKQKAEDGLDVRVMYDGFGSLVTLPEDYDKQLEKFGIKAIVFNPISPIFSMVVNNRDHRKIMVIDGDIAYNGGINLADEYINKTSRFGHWKDTGIRLNGDATWSFTLMFISMWQALKSESEDVDSYKGIVDNFNIDTEISVENVKKVNNIEIETEKIDKGFVQPFDDTPLDEEAVAENVYIEILNQAVDYVYIYTPYLIIGDEMKHSLCLAVKRGVDVKIITPGIPDKKMVFKVTRANYRDLLNAGVEIYEYKPGFIHAKSYVADDKYGVVGTINMDYRSLYLHFECGTFMYKTPMLKDLKEDFIETMNKSTKINKNEIKGTLLHRMFISLLKLLSPLI